MGRSLQPQRPVRAARATRGEPEGAPTALNRRQPRAAANDNNNAPTADPNWEPFCVTPPFPEYNSTHAATGAAAEALKLELGDSHGFKVDSPTLQGLSRNYNKFTEAAFEERPLAHLLRHSLPLRVCARADAGRRDRAVRAQYFLATPLARV
jgi:hypothetical protein